MTSSRAKTKNKLFKRAKDLAVNRDPKEAIKLIDALLANKKSTDSDLLLLKGSILELIANYDEASKIYRSILRLDQRNTQAWIDLGDVYAAKNQYSRAIRYYNHALNLLKVGHFYIDKTDESVRAIIGKAKCMVEMKRPLAACRYIINALSRYPTDELLISNLQRAAEEYNKHQTKGAHNVSLKGGNRPKLSVPL